MERPLKILLDWDLLGKRHGDAWTTSLITLLLATSFLVPFSRDKIFINHHVSLIFKDTSPFVVQ